MNSWCNCSVQIFLLKYQTLIKPPPRASGHSYSSEGGAKSYEEPHILLTELFPFECLCHLRNRLSPNSINIFHDSLRVIIFFYFCIFPSFKQEQLHIWLILKQGRNCFLWPHSWWKALCNTVLWHWPVPGIQLPQWTAPDLTALQEFHFYWRLLPNCMEWLQTFSRSQGHFYYSELRTGNNQTVVLFY